MSRLGQRDWHFPALWGAWVGTLALVALIWTGGGIVPALLGAAALAVLAGAGVYSLAVRRIDERVLVGTSAAPLVIATGATVGLNGVAFGSWLFLVGVEFIAFGVFLLIRERRAVS